MNTEEKKGKGPAKGNTVKISEKERHKGKMDRAESKAQAIKGKGRSKKAGHEAVSDQKSHEYH